MNLGRCLLLSTGATLGLVATLASAAEPAPDQRRAQAAELLRLADEHYAGFAEKVDDARARELFEQAAATGDPVAQLRVATLYHLGKGGFPKDRDKASRLAAGSFDAVLARARQGDHEAEFCIGSVFLLGVGRSPQPELAVDWYQKSAEAQSWASHNLGWMYETGTGTRRDLALALRWYEQAAAAGNVAGMYEAGVAHILGQGTSRDPERGLSLLIAAAARRYSWAMSYLGYLTLSGSEGVPRDPEVGRIWLEEAILEGLPRALDDLMRLDREGQLPEAERKATLARLEKESDAGNVHAKIALAKLLRDGWLGAEPDAERSFQLALAAAESGSTQAMNSLAYAYWNGRGVPRDRRAAIDWWERGARLGDHLAQYRLGLRYLEGEGMRRDLDRGLSWLKASADQGFWAATLQLARAHEHGWYGVSKDRAAARMWYERAAALGVDEAKGWLRAERQLGGQ